jgi:hypothetical protein
VDNETTCHACDRETDNAMLCAACAKRYRLHRYSYTDWGPEGIEPESFSVCRTDGFMTDSPKEVTCKRCLQSLQEREDD